MSAPPIALDDTTVPALLQKGVQLTKVSNSGRKKRMFRIDPEAGEIHYESKKSEKVVPIQAIKEIRVGGDAEHYLIELGFKQTDLDKWLTIIYVLEDAFKMLHVLAPNREILLLFESTVRKLYSIRMGLMLSMDNVQFRNTVWEKQYFKFAAAAGHDSATDTISFEEIKSLCARLHANLTKDELEKLFNQADTDHKNSLTFAEFQSFVKALKRRPELEALHKKLSGEKPFDFSVFERFMKETQKSILSSEELKTMFAKYTIGSTPAACSTPPVVNATAPLPSVAVTAPATPAPAEGIQPPAPSLPAAPVVVQAPPPPSNVTMDVDAFASFLLSEDSTVIKPQSNDMTKPMSDYFISTSHNTYLAIGVSTIEGYIRALLCACRSVELDVYDGPQGPVVYHGRTWTSRVSVEDICKAIAKYAFTASPFPVVLSCEVHCGIEQQDMLVDIMVEAFGPALVRVEEEHTKISSLPSPEELKGRILTKNLLLSQGVESIMAHKKAAKDAADAAAKAQHLDVETSESESESESEARAVVNEIGAEFSELKSKWRKLRGKEPSTKDTDGKAAKTKPPMSLALASLLVYTVGVKYRGMGSKPDEYAPEQIFSLSESKAKKFFQEDAPEFKLENLIRHTQTHVVRIYPKGTRVNSTNYEPIPFWAAGCQLVALNIQTLDLGYRINQAMFMRCGRQGYVLKPLALRDTKLELIKKRTEGFLDVTIISAQQLPLPRDASGREKSNIDPYVEVVLHIPGWSNAPFLPKGAYKQSPSEDSDAQASTRRISYSTRVVKDNGFNPQFQEELCLPFDCIGDMKELIFVEFLVKREGKSDEEPLASFIAPLSSLEQGFRHLPLHDSQLCPHLFSTLDDALPAAKRRKLEPAGSFSSQPVQSSFTEVLERLKEESAEGNKEDGGGDSWARPPLPDIDPKRDSIIFQQIDIEEADVYSTVHLQLFGEGHSVLAHVTGFQPYFYVAQPRGFQESDLEPFRAHLNSLTTGEFVTEVSVVSRRSLWQYRGDDYVPFLKLTITNPKSLPKRNECKYAYFSTEGPIATFESNIAYTLRFMIDTKVGWALYRDNGVLTLIQVVGMNWIEVPADKYTILTGQKRKSRCQLEISVNYNDFISYAPEGDWATIAPLRILSFDIECAGRKGIFPEADVDPVIQIANMVTRQGEQKPFIRNVFTLNTCSNILGSQVLSYKKEDKMLQAWSDFVSEVDPDVVIGYNIAGFDFPYLLDRAKALKMEDFAYLGRLMTRKTETKDTHFSSKAYGQRDSKETALEGRLQLDVLQYMQREHKLRSYTLNSVCAQFLGEQKEDVHHSVITELQNGTPESRRRLAVYCLKDAYLPQRLLDKLMCFVNYTEMARVTGVPFNYLLARGQSIKVLSQLFRRANEEGTDEQYEGATVIEPKKGYYDAPIATLDFSSLYPSIMMAHNLCYTTLLDKATVNRLNLVKDVDYITTPNNDMFATSKKRKGLLPMVLEDLIAARKRAKADLKKEQDPFRRAVLDGRQLALKISANSVYGFTGATVGKLPCLEISSSVTAYGRQMIEKTKQEVEAEYCVENGHSHNAEVIYGDTDSVMVKFGPMDLAKVMQMGAEAADLVTTKFVKPIKLEFEKVYFPYLLISKKRYAGLYWTRPEKYDKMDTKGIETVRRDNCRLVSTVIETCLHKMLIDRDVKGAEDYTKQTISDLLQNKIDMSQLVITKALAKADYAAKQAHVELAERMKKRDAGSAPALGDRVAYVIIKGMKGAPAYDKSEDPLYVLENNVPIDTKYYLENQLSKPLMRIFEPILGEKANSLLSGDHTRTIQIATPTVGGLMKFAVKTVTCLGCKTALRGNNSVKNGAVCKDCRPRMGELFQKQISTTSALQVQFARLWTQCQRCQGSLHQDVLCTSKDCPIFYMRKKAQKDVEDAAAVLERFESDSW
ncbi:DNA polymerase [Mycena kentingensis (nom. inval.)]|nr:DNA polymerase [Mycena kentingensis (nom. inval.)]